MRASSPGFPGWPRRAPPIWWRCASGPRSAPSCAPTTPCSRPDAVELGGDPAEFWAAIARHGLLLPASWLGAGWPALWARSFARPAPRTVTPS
ncbi:hypothetical protein [Actinoplanes sp. NPDC049316]|uniref:hypothetical protein n=1 Tax=Actinoplanes sp. NPDC049316 TaxID=3154727 RepID=UPI00341B1F26